MLPRESSDDGNKSRGIDVNYIRVDDVAQLRAPVVEIWTKNHIYFLNDAFFCVAVRNRNTGLDVPNHSLTGARLTGGQRKNRTTGVLEVVYPLPVAGFEAVFRHPDTRGGSPGFGLTSRVERVVFNVRKYRGSLGEDAPAEESTGTFKSDREQPHE